MLIRTSFRYLILSLLIISNSACNIATKKKDNVATNAIAAAKTANSRAITENYEWRDTAVIIKKAERALANGDNVKATNLANLARRQAENAVKQKYSELKRLKHMLGGN